MPGSAWRNVSGAMIRRKRSERDMPQAVAASISPDAPREGTPENFRLLRAGGDPDSKGTGQETRKADEAAGAEQPADRRDNRAAAEIEEIDDQKIGNAAKDRRIGVARHG